MYQTITLTAAEYTASPARECDNPGRAILLAALFCIVLFWAPIVIALSVLL